MNEADTRQTYITPKLRAAGWVDDQIREQATFTDGRIVAYLDGLPPDGHLRRAKINARRVGCRPCCDRTPDGQGRSRENCKYANKEVCK